MKISTIVSIVIMVLFTCCSDLLENSESKFPECIGTKESFDPQKLSNAYFGEIWNEDTTFSTSFTFTDYNELDLYYMSRSWKLWIKFNYGTTTTYQSYNCFKLQTPEKWYAWTGMDYKNKYSTWDLLFDTLDCSEISGNCTVIFPAESDTLHFLFKGTR